MKSYHILNGDCLAEQLKDSSLEANFIICRECLIDGPLKSDNISVFWSQRAAFIHDNFEIGETGYFEKSVTEFEKILNLKPNVEVCLWFENDLFCQANMWFVISLLINRTDIQIYRVFPMVQLDEDMWKGFSISNTEMLEHSYFNKVLFQPGDLDLGNKLWGAYQNNDLESLKGLSKTQSTCFQHLPEVCQAHIDRYPLGDFWAVQIR